MRKTTFIVVLPVILLMACNKLVIDIEPVFEYVDISIQNDSTVTKAYFESPDVGYAYSPRATYKTTDAGLTWKVIGPGSTGPTKDIIENYRISWSWDDCYILTNLTSYKEYKVLLEFTGTQTPRDIFILNNKVYVVGNEGAIGQGDIGSDVFIKVYTSPIDGNDHYLIDGTDEIIVILGTNSIVSNLDIGSGDRWNHVLTTDLKGFRGDFLSLDVLNRENITIVRKGGKILKGRI